MGLQLKTVGFSLLFAVACFAQSDRGTITGTISDPGGAVVPNAPIEARNTQTGAAYAAASSGTGNYTLAELPTGTYELSITAPGFKKFIRSNIILPVAQTVRVDATLEVGASSESVTVTTDAPLLKTESGELSHNVTGETMDELPVLSIGLGGASGTGLRNPYAVLNLIPGATWLPDSAIRINGMPSNTESLKIEGQDATTGLWYTQSWTSPSIDAIQEVSIQTSNYAPEFGQAGGGVFNTTMKSGTNTYHGSGYEYFVNEALNASQPFINLRPRTRQNDYGFTLGGPVRIPRVYDGTNKTFFFFAFEQYRNNQLINNVFSTVPTLAMRNGDFSALPLIPVGTDTITGLPIYANQIFDPTTDHVVNGVVERNPFPNNVIPTSRFDPIAAKIQSFYPLPSGPNANALLNNYLPTYRNPKNSMVPSLKADQSLSDKSKVSFFWQRTSLDTPSNDGLPQPITTARGYNSVTNTERINYDQTLSPTRLLHVGIGLLNLNYQEVSQPFNVKTGLASAGAPNGLTGTGNPDFFPTIGGLNNGFGGGGFGGLGAFTHAQVINIKPTANTSLTWVRGNHTYKFGGELLVDGYINRNNTYAIPWITFSAAETSNPAFVGLPLSIPAGFNYASFLLGRVDSGYTSVPTDTRLGKHAIAFFAQDSWKVTRKLTFDYGLRYDYQTYLKEQHGVQASFSPSTPNPGAGNLPGGTIFEATCKCNFAKNYPWAFGPRLGVAYQFLPKWVLRAGAGISYSKTAGDNFQSYAVGGNIPYSAPAFGYPAYQLSSGLPYPLIYPNFDPGQYPVNGIPTGSLGFFDQNAGRPARTTSWSIGIQRELPGQIVVDASYVGNRGVWWQANTAINDNAIQPALLAQGHNGLSATTIDPLTGKTLMLEQLGQVLGTSTAAQYKLTLPYSRFPLTQTVAQSVRPYPEYTSILRLWNPDGDTWYNALQVKASKRFSHGLQFASSFTWSKNQMNGAEGDVNFFQAVSTAENDVFNRKINKYLSAFDQPFAFIFNATYTVPKIGGNKVLSLVARDWMIGTVLRYQSGLPILAPIATNGLNSTLFENTFANRVPGQPLFLQDPNSHYDPNGGTGLLNPAAWTNPPAGTFGTSAAYYSDYRRQRAPQENVSLARNFRFRERMNLEIRAEFTNVFNRVVLAAPTSSNAGSVFRAGVNGTGTGFGYVNATTTAIPPRAGQLVARFSF